MVRHRKHTKVFRVNDFKSYHQKIVGQAYRDFPPKDNPPINDSSFRIIPTVKRYTYVTKTNIDLTGGTNIPASLFYNDDGSPTIEFMNFSPNGYANLYVNALMQRGGIYQVSSNTLTINAANAMIYANTPIIIELLTFSTEPIY